MARETDSMHRSLDRALARPEPDAALLDPDPFPGYAYAGAVSDLDWPPACGPRLREALLAAPAPTLVWEGDQA